VGVMLLVAITSAVAKNIEELRARWTGRCSLLGETMTAFDLPTISALLYIQVSIHITEGETSLKEYAPPQPQAYIRFDAVPSDLQYDTKGRFDGLEWQWTQHRPKKAQRVYVKIKGGLTEALQLQCAYSLKPWKVVVEAEYRYCPQDWELGADLQDCNLRVITVVPGKNYTTVGEYTVGRVEVPLYTANMQFRRISGDSDAVAVISPWNYVEFASNSTDQAHPEAYFLNTNAATVPSPRAGTWFLHIKSGEKMTFGLILDPQNPLNRPKELIVSKEGSVPFSLATIPTQHTANTTSLLHFSLTPQFIHDKHTLKLSFPNIREKGKQGLLLACLYRGSPQQDTLYWAVNSSLSALRTTDSLLLQLDYLYSELNILAIELYSDEELGILGVGVVSSPCGVENCSGDSCERLSGPVPVSICDCRGPRAGTNCEKQALTRLEFALWVVLLTASNLAMLPALYLSFWKYGKYGEGCVFLSTMVTSFMYHACDSQYFCFFLQSAGLRHTDFYLSYLSIAVSILYLARLKADLKLGFTMLYVVLLLYAMTQTHFNSLVAEVGVPVSAGLVPLGVYLAEIGKFSYRLEGKWWSWKVMWRFCFSSGNFRWKYGALAAGSFATALFVNLCLQGNHSYWLVSPTQTHSLWHVCIMLTPAFVLSVFPPRPAAFTVHWESEGCQPLL